MNPIRITQNLDADEQLLYFTSSSLTADDRLLWFISDRTGHPNIFCDDRIKTAIKPKSRWFFKILRLL
jgi:hypothetical protein